MIFNKLNFHFRLDHVQQFVSHLKNILDEILVFLLKLDEMEWVKHKVNLLEEIARIVMKVVTLEIKVRLNIICFSDNSC